MNPIVIIGSGMAGYGLLREFRKRDPDTPVTLITADDGRVYSKPNLSNAFAQNRAPAQLASDTAARAAGKFRASVLTHTRVEAIDTAGKRLATDAGEIVYGRLVLALGADPIASGLDGPLVQAINDLDDYTRFRAALDGKRRVTILGGGLIGCEFANDLVGNALVAETGAKAIEVDVVHRGAWPLERLIPEAVGQALAEALEQRGARWHFGRTASRIEADTGGARVLLDDGEELETDLVLSAIGLRPRVELASAAGIAVGRGIVVDRELRTSAPEVWAIGDCAEVEGHVLPFVQPLLIQARALAARLAGEEVRVTYPAMPVVVKTGAYPLAVLPPPAGTAGAWRVETGDGGLRALFEDAAGNLAGFALSGKETARRAELAARVPPLLA